MVQSLKKIKEIVFVEEIKKRFGAHSRDVLVSIGDDAAVVRGPGGTHLLYTADMLIEGVHFKKNEDPEKIGYKALAVSVSDIAAMGGIPRQALVCVGLPKKNTQTVLRGLTRGLERCAKKFNMDIIGGDINRSRCLVIDCFVVGEVEKNKVVLRSGARSGDHIFVTGPLGGSQKGRHLSFVPRVKEARFLSSRFRVTSMIDLSDGLGLDLNRIAQASNAGALIFENKIPKNKGVKRVEAALFDGEDFELLFTLSAASALKLTQLARTHKVCGGCRSIGRMTDLFKGVRLVRGDGRITEVIPQGFQHF